MINIIKRCVAFSQQSDAFSKQNRTLVLLADNDARDNSSNFSREGLNAGGKVSTPFFSN